MTVRVSTGRSDVTVVAPRVFSAWTFQVHPLPTFDSVDTAQAPVRVRHTVPTKPAKNKPRRRSVLYQVLPPSDDSHIASLPDGHSPPTKADASKETHGAYNAFHHGEGEAVGTVELKAAGDTTHNPNPSPASRTVTAPAPAPAAASAVASAPLRLPTTTAHAHATGHAPVLSNTCLAPGPACDGGTTGSLVVGGYHAATAFSIAAPPPVVSPPLQASRQPHANNTRYAPSLTLPTADASSLYRAACVSSIAPSPPPPPVEAYTACVGDVLRPPAAPPMLYHAASTSSIMSEHECAGAGPASADSTHVDMGMDMELDVDVDVAGLDAAYRASEPALALVQPGSRYHSASIVSIKEADVGAVVPPAASVAAQCPAADASAAALTSAMGDGGMGADDGYGVLCDPAVRREPTGGGSNDKPVRAAHPDEDNAYHPHVTNLAVGHVGASVYSFGGAGGVLDGHSHVPTPIRGTSAAINSSSNGVIQADAAAYVEGSIDAGRGASDVIVAADEAAHTARVARPNFSAQYRWNEEFQSLLSRPLSKDERARRLQVRGRHGWGGMGAVWR